MYPAVETFQVALRARVRRTRGAAASFLLAGAVVGPLPAIRSVAGSAGRLYPYPVSVCPRINHIDRSPEASASRGLLFERMGPARGAQRGNGSARSAHGCAGGVRRAG